MAESPSPPERPVRLSTHVELVVVIFLGLVSVATAFTSFQSGLYHGQSDDIRRARPPDPRRVPLPGRQPAVRAGRADRAAPRRTSTSTRRARTGHGRRRDRQIRRDLLHRRLPDLDAAIQWGRQLDESRPRLVSLPAAGRRLPRTRGTAPTTGSPRCGGASPRAISSGSGDQLGFSTTLMAITLFLLGIAAVVRNLGCGGCSSRSACRSSP